MRLPAGRAKAVRPSALLDSVDAEAAFHAGGGLDDPEELEAVGDEEAAVGDGGPAGLAKADFVGPKDIPGFGVRHASSPVAASNATTSEVF